MDDIDKKLLKFEFKKNLNRLKGGKYPKSSFKESLKRLAERSMKESIRSDKISSDILYFQNKILKKPLNYTLMELLYNFFQKEFEELGFEEGRKRDRIFNKMEMLLIKRNRYYNKFKILESLNTSEFDDVYLEKIVYQKEKNELKYYRYRYYALKHYLIGQVYTEYNPGNEMYYRTKKEFYGIICRKEKKRKLIVESFKSEFKRLERNMSITKSNFKYYKDSLGILINFLNSNEFDEFENVKPKILEIISSLYS